MRRRRWPVAKAVGWNNGVHSRADQWAGLPGKVGPENAAPVPPEPMEGPVREEECGQIEVPLKNGAGWMKIGAARIAQEELRLLLLEGPEYVTALHALVEGRGDEVSHEHYNMLKRERMLTRAGGVRADIKAIMIAAYRESVAGLPVIEEPLDLTKPEHAAAVQCADDMIDRLGRATTPGIRLRLAEIAGKTKNKDNSRS
jgi:hypothetical protein